MDRSMHCRLCKNQIQDIHTGMRCGITGELPAFENRCPDIQLGERFNLELRKVNVESERVRKLKPHAIFQSSVYTAVGLAIIIAGYLLGSFVFEAGVISTVPIIIMGVGFLALSTAFGPLNSYRNQSKLAAEKKRDIDLVLELYGISYSANVSFGKEYHGVTETEVEITFQGKSELVRDPKV